MNRLKAGLILSDSHMEKKKQQMGIREELEEKVLAVVYILIDLHCIITKG